MRLSSVEVIPYALPFAEPYVTARGVLQRREMVLLRLRDEDGVVGLGEAVPLALRGGVGLAEVAREHGWPAEEMARYTSGPSGIDTSEPPAQTVRRTTSAAARRQNK